MPRLRPRVWQSSGWLLFASFIVSLALPAPAAAQTTGTVTGTVTDAGTGTPIGSAIVSVVTIRNSIVGSGTTDASGVYTISGVPQGALYYVQAQATGYSTHLHPNISCLTASCSTAEILESSPVSVPPGSTVNGRNIALQPGGGVSGRVTDAATGAGISSVPVGLVLGGGTGTRFTTTDSSGNYSFMGLPPGQYYLFTTLSPSAGYRNEIYDNIGCILSCQNAAIRAGTPTTVTAGATVTGRDFALETGGRISGTVANALTGAPLGNTVVTAATRVGTTILSTSVLTNAAGAYTIGGLASASYSVFTASNTTTNEIHPDILCPITCSATAAADSGTPVNVTLEGTTGGVDFQLDQAGNLSGTVTNETTGVGINGAIVIAVLRTATGTATRGVVTNASGGYTIQGLPRGDYALYTNTSGFANEIFDNVPCPTTGCNATTAVAIGTLSPVTPGTTTANRNFALQPVTVTPATGNITGTITDASSGLPIAGILVEVHLSAGSSLTLARTAATDTSGVYSATFLAAGTYRLATFGPSPYRNEVFDNIPCLSTSCANLGGGTPVALSAGGTGTANFGLDAGDGVNGTVTSAATGLPLQGVSVFFYQVGSNAFAGSATTNAEGRYAMRGLPNAQYVAFTSSSLGVFDEIYDNIQCTASCSSTTALASGGRITISGAAAFAGADLAELVTGINFALETRTQPPAAPSNFRVVTIGSTATFMWTAPSLLNAGAPTSYLLEAGSTPGTTFITLPIAGTNTTFAVPGVPPGAYYVRLRAVNASGAGPASNEVRLVVGATGVGLPDAPTNLSAFMSNGLLTMTWSPALTGGPSSGYVVEAGSASGASNVATLNVTNATFSFSPVPDGFYFLRVRARNATGVSAPTAEVLVVVGNVPAPPGAPDFNSHTVSDSTVTLSWAAPAFGPVTSYVVEAGSAPGLANLALANVGNVLTQSFVGVPPGTYYVRVRAVNANGASVVSTERTIIVS